MNMRRITSLTAMLSFVMMVLTSVILYIVPQGRIAYWSDWRLWGLTKTDWGNIHINLGILFLISLFLHIYYNWRPIVTYMKNRSKKLKIFTPAFNIALVINLAFIIGTYFLVPPFGWIMNLSDTIKDAGAAKYGEPPYGHAELSSLKTFSKKLSLDLPAAMEQLHSAGIAITSEDETMLDIARHNGISPQQVYLAMKPTEKIEREGVQAVKDWPEIPPAGFGRRTLADVCGEFDLNIPELIRILSMQGVQAEAEKTIKSISESNNQSPIDFYDMLRKAAKTIAS